MKWSFATIGVIMLGLIGLSVIILFQQVTTSNENDYYLLKEITEAAMIDAIDIAYYRDTGDLKISEEKFVENFVRRFAESTVFVSSDYKISFYDIMETPPKVSIVIAGLGEYTVGGNADEYNIANKLDAILEYTGTNTFKPSSINPYESKTVVMSYYGISDITNGKYNNKYSLKVPEQLNMPNVKNAEIKEIKNIQVVNDQGDDQGELNKALLQLKLSYNNINDIDYMQSINGFASSIDNVSFDYYNCGTGTSDYSCNDVDKHWISINGTASGKKVVYKYDIIWSYDEYEFNK